MQNSKQVKVVVLVKSGVGMSSIVLRFVADNFKGDKDTTIGASNLTKILSIGDTNIMFSIWDTAGQERYGPLASHVLPRRRRCCSGLWHY
mmetsp:Transcript_31562/g.54682  ORF Transcript_31562/g.54682 Transcript_31562/m.54682 type:complete len:90 (+) Transcript_31562:1741-2010(+)